MEQLLRFIKKNIKIELCYKFSLIAQIFSLTVSLLIFFLIDKYFQTYISNSIPQDITYFQYIFVSFLILNYSSGNSVLIQHINFDINSGVFEFIVNSKNIYHYMLSLWLYSFAISTLEAILYLLFIYFTGLMKLNILFLDFFILIFISSIVFSSIHFIGASFIILFKRGNIISFFVGTVESLLCGVYVPIEILGKISTISSLFPMTHSISAAQKIVNLKKSIFSLSEMYILIIFCSILTPLSIYLFKKSIELSRKIGNLSQY
ncbi:MAG: ABC transporter permease [Elusimicrobiales bacterium]|nr:ABC transporter permease [Elusimicrobiales bacterium]